MLNAEAEKIITTSRNYGWILEPDAKRILDLSGIKVPRFEQAQTVQAAVRAVARGVFCAPSPSMPPPPQKMKRRGSVRPGIRI